MGRTKKTETTSKEDGMLDVEEQQDSEEDMWPEGHTAREDRAYGPTENDRVKQEHPNRRDAVKRTSTNAGGTLGVPE